MNIKKKGNDVGIKVVQPDSATQWDPMTTCLQTMCCTCELCLRVFAFFDFRDCALAFGLSGRESLKGFFLELQ